LAAGDPVAVDPLIICGACPKCRRGKDNLCRKIGSYGISGDGGGFAEFIVVPAERLYPLDGLGTDEGALVEPIAVATSSSTRGRKTSSLRCGNSPRAAGPTWIDNGGQHAKILVQPSH
jgi:(R,R)-butanediol dehydrogenase/meso-butanediol dehydrogenase/diacetyl reductase